MALCQTKYILRGLALLHGKRGRDPQQGKCGQKLSDTGKRHRGRNHGAFPYHVLDAGGKEGTAGAAVGGDNGKDQGSGMQYYRFV